VADVVGQKGLIRLHQIELQAQAIRMLARPDIQQFLKLDSQQAKKIETLFQATDAIAKQISPTKPDTAKQEELQSANKKEMTEGFAVLKPEQAQRLPLTFGKEFNTAVLERIYPLAPEFVGAEKQLKSIGSNWQELKGKVVLVHFYAYECHNCHANFPHYNRWHSKLKSKGVEVVGIQTPETANEKVAENIIRAAKKDGFQFPVVLDLDSQNWKSWGNTMWPTVYVVDKNGYIRFWWQGELNWNGATVDKTIEKLVEQLLEE
jgi:peroxiredoxin